MGGRALLCVATALLRERPRWWLGAGAAAGIGVCAGPTGGWRTLWPHLKHYD